MFQIVKGTAEEIQAKLEELEATAVGNLVHLGNDIFAVVATLPKGE